MHGFIFSDCYTEYSSDSFIAFIGGIEGESDLFVQYQKELEFPWYFGHNWDAFDECIRNLEWIENKHIVIVHDSLPILSSEDLKIYIDILLYAIKVHNKRCEQIFDVIFYEKDKEVVEKVISSIDLVKRGIIE